MKFTIHGGPMGRERFLKRYGLLVTNQARWVGHCLLRKSNGIGWTIKLVFLIKQWKRCRLSPAINGKLKCVRYTQEHGRI